METHKRTPCCYTCDLLMAACIEETHRRFFLSHIAPVHPPQIPPEPLQSSPAPEQNEDQCALCRDLNHFLGANCCRLQLYGGENCPNKPRTALLLSICLCCDSKSLPLEQALQYKEVYTQHRAKFFGSREGDPSGNGRSAFKR